MSYARIAVFVSGGGTNLQALLDAQKSGILNKGKVELVISDREGCYALERAEKSGIKSFCFIKKQIGQSLFEQKLNEMLKVNNIDFIILAGFLSILSAEFTKAWDMKIINVHPSLIPSFCGDGYYGLKVHSAALERGVKISGATVHYVNGDVDGGPIIFQKVVPVYKKDTPETLQIRIMKKAEWVLLPKAAQQLSQKIVKQKEKSNEK